VAESDDRDLYSGLIRLHVLHHASEEPIFGLGMLEELGRHGYKISPGTLLPNSARSWKKRISPLDGTARGQVTPQSLQCYASRP